jgi:hypothetical protein
MFFHLFTVLYIEGCTVKISYNLKSVSKYLVTDLKYNLRPIAFFKH